MQGRKTVRITVRFTPEEARKIRKRAEENKMPVAAYLRMLAKQKPENHPEIQKQLNLLINEVNRIGVNINQITKKQNVAGCGRDDYNRLSAYMQRLNMTVRDVVMNIGNK